MGALEDDGRCGPEGALGGPAGDAAERHPAGIGLLQHREQAEQGRLAGAVGAEHGEQFSLREFDVADVYGGLPP